MTVTERKIFLTFYPSLIIWLMILEFYFFINWYRILIIIFFSDNQELKVQEAEWVKETTDRVYSLLKETPPDGESFSKTVEHILKVLL